MSAFVCGASYQNHKPADEVSGCPSLGLSASFPVLVAGIPEEGDEVSVDVGKRLETASNAGNDMMSPHGNAVIRISTEMSRAGLAPTFFQFGVLIFIK